MTDALVQVIEQDGRVVLAVRGEVDLANYQAVEEQINHAISNQSTLVQIDLSQLAYIDSAGLRMLFNLANRLIRLQINLELIAPEASPARRAVDLSGLSSAVTVLSQRG
ncbi:MAG TPA: STAS domain-containing protein [Acidimicrobiales bacterium]|nr:STAS domain-containing protein [Acidimicrobiales bacterium]